jgi:hypothetical protein
MGSATKAPMPTQTKYNHMHQPDIVVGSFILQFSFGRLTGRNADLDMTTLIQFVGYGTME